MAAIVTEEDMHRYGSSLFDAPTPDWKQIVHTTMKTGHTINVYSRALSGTSLTEYRGIGIMVGKKATSLMRLNLQLEDRKAWDEHCLDCRQVDFIDGSQVVYWVVKFPWPMSDREYTFSRRAGIVDGAHCVVSRAMTHPGAPPNGRYTHVDPFFSACGFRDLPNGDCEYSLHYYDDIKTVLPSALIKWITKKAIPKMVQVMADNSERYDEPDS
eukprot:gnl/Spiro4/16821_TR9054_c0_g1_i1.p2 gnl/Spiro4/16821_TR9054_c0_g1~~gnl/Spiro4/16821_TR9054_c0_g1_i1.p2  ORF type:complete len:236 (+),score=70.58 gnl/Spiro4/16821_TR9054_c0_g1_i1:71-709(+)